MIGTGLAPRGHRRQAAYGDGAAPAGSLTLLAVMLRGADRQEAGYELTKLEADWVQALAGLFSKEEARELGQVFGEEAGTRAPPAAYALTATAFVSEVHHPLWGWKVTFTDTAGTVLGSSQALIDRDRRHPSSLIDTARRFPPYACPGHVTHAT
ncbi:hypothetical protein [Streptomyces sp. H27-D2]|uniref:hypothetical protein n=1 Tax=Streptomyces sp. H27-D2 TaxID=3046304 RepID=UPI002DB670CB|nr:hypothetical protein [Streptomyces sp. H27-D2]MEC4016387.1 hypothetical protein [Streptomyces sp. H27-D2]